MAQQKRIRTNQPRAAVTHAVRGLPREIRTPNTKANQLFVAYLLQHLSQRIYDNFIRKSKGESDELGYSWKPLAPSTIKKKSRGYSPNKRVDADTINPEVRKLWQKLYKTYRRQLGGRGAERQARSLAWQQIRDQGLGDVPIGIDTGELVKAVRPGKVRGTRYVPPKQQQVEYQHRKIAIEYDVDHAKYFHKTRRIYPPINKMKSWVKDAVSAATQQVIERFSRDLT